MAKRQKIFSEEISTLNSNDEAQPIESWQHKTTMCVVIINFYS